MVCRFVPQPSIKLARNDFIGRKYVLMRKLKLLFYTACKSSHLKVVDE